MTPPPATPAAAPPPWQHCADGVSANDPGCRGHIAPPYRTCLTHLDDTELSAYLGGLAAGDNIDHRGTTFTGDVLRQLLEALRDPVTGVPHLGVAQFDDATFIDIAQFDGVRFGATATFTQAEFQADADFNQAAFSGPAIFEQAMFSSTAGFNEATFYADAGFSDATFSGPAGFSDATFSNVAWFEHARFLGDAGFEGAVFTGSAWFSWAIFSSTSGFNEAAFSATAGFSKVRFSDHAGFDGTMFSGAAWFDKATFSGDAWFSQAVFCDGAAFSEAAFNTTSTLGPLVCRGTFDLSAARFSSPMTIEMATTGLKCQRSSWASTATLHLRYATVDLSDVVVEHPLCVTARHSSFVTSGGTPIDESLLNTYDYGVRVASVSGVDAAHLVLTNADLSTCRFIGAIHLDQIRLEGSCSFAPAPAGLHRRRLLPMRWTPRHILVEEHHWRAAGGATGWTPAPVDVDSPMPAALASMYRQLRKSLEDGKNEPDAGDFYYGEMEMRRHDVTRSLGDRALLAAYWALSGYGLRATRALGWLLAAMTVTLLALMLWGLPKDTPNPETTGKLTGQRVTLAIDPPAPINPDDPLLDRLTAERFEKAMRSVINSVVFRSSSQDLTTAGTYTEMASRLVEPALLGLTVLAIRSRVKR